MTEKCIGKVYGKLKVLSYGKEENKNKVLCECECGNKKYVLLQSLKSGNTKSCGCTRKEINCEWFVTHGLSKHPLFNIWYQMVSRCNRESHPDYHNYGGRGIQVCEEWKDSPQKYIDDIELFLGDKPSANHSLDRIDNDKDYKISNMKWSSRTEQNINRRSQPKKTGMRNILNTPSGAYRVKLRREKTVRTSKSIYDVDRVIELRDSWIQEYKEDRDGYIRNTLEEKYFRQ